MGIIEEWHVPLFPSSFEQKSVLKYARLLALEETCGYRWMSGSRMPSEPSYLPPPLPTLVLTIEW